MFICVYLLFQHYHVIFVDFLGRIVYELTLNNSIRYANGDGVERWLYDLLCLDVTDLPPLTGGTPDPASCDLYYVNRDTLFSYDRSAETFLKHLVNLYVSSHYKVSNGNKINALFFNVTCIHYHVIKMRSLSSCF